MQNAVNNSDPSSVMNFRKNGRFRNIFRNLIKTETSYKYAAVISVTTAAGIGIISSWPSPALPHLMSPVSNFPITEIQGAWIASVLGFGIIFGFIINPIFVNRFGSKRTLLILAAPQILSWTIIYLGRNWLLLCFARIVGGFGYGAGLCSTAIYLSEIGDEKNRGAFLSLIKLSINTGIFVIMALGASLSYDAINLVLMIIPIVFALAFFPMPDKKEIQTDEYDDDVLGKLTQNGFDDDEEQRINNGDVEDRNNFIEDKMGLKRRLNNFPESAKGLQDHQDILEENTDNTKKHPNCVSKSAKELHHHLNAFYEDADDLKQHPNNSTVLNHQPDDLAENTYNFINHPNDFTKTGIDPDKYTDGIRLITSPVGNGITENTKNWEETKRPETVENKVNSFKKETIKEEVSKLLQTSTSCPFEKKSSNNIWWKLFMLKNNRKALVIIMIAGLTDIFSGHVVITVYTQQIFGYSGASLKPEYAALIFGSLKIGASLIATLMVKKFGRRILFFSTGVCAGLSEGSVGLFYFLKFYLKMDVSSITWLPLLGLAMYEVIGTLGQSSLYFVYQGELLSDDVKSVGITLTNISYNLVTIFVRLYFQRVVDTIGIHSVFFGFGMCCIFGSCLIFCISPETKGKSKVEIRKLLS